MSIEWQSFAGVTSMVCTTSDYIQFMVGKPFGPWLCSFFFELKRAAYIVNFNKLFQLAALKFLYTNVWKNIGCTNDEFWAFCIQVINLVHFLVIWGGAVVGSFSKHARQAICLGVPDNCQDTVLGSFPLPSWVCVCH